MNKLINIKSTLIPVMVIILAITSCNKMYDTKQGLNLTESDLYKEWNEYRSAAIGLYGLQTKLVEQLFVLGELRGDLVKITDNADADLKEIYNFNYSKTNKYVSPTNFYKLIAACNSFIRIVKTKHPEVLKLEVSPTQYDQIYAEALCMRAWAYFNAVRIYGKVPYIYEDLVTVDQIEKFVNSPDDTTKRQYYDMSKIVSVFTDQLENEVKTGSDGEKVVGFKYDYVNEDPTWEVTTWHYYSYQALLGQMYLFVGNFDKAHDHFEKIIPRYGMVEDLSQRYDLNTTYAGNSWRNIFTGIGNKEHIYTIYFNKSTYSQNGLQDLIFNDFMVKPTKAAITNWESQWYGSVLNRLKAKPDVQFMDNVGNPGDRYRGYGVSYICKKLNFSDIMNSDKLDTVKYYNMMHLRSKGDLRGSKSIMEGYDTLIYKYMLGKTEFSKDINYIVYRAAEVHLYQAEVYLEQNDAVSTENIINTGAYFYSTANRTQRGVRGRVGLGGTPDQGLDNFSATRATTNSDDPISFLSPIYYHDPYTNEIIGYDDFSLNEIKKNEYIEDKILKERALELAFEGERFYDLMRFTQRRIDKNSTQNDILAKLVSAKFPAGDKERIYTYLKNPYNWYIHYFDVK